KQQTSQPKKLATSLSSEATGLTELLPTRDVIYFIRQTMLTNLQCPLLALIGLLVNQCRGYYMCGIHLTGCLDKHDFGFNSLDEQHDLESFYARFAFHVRS